MAASFLTPEDIAQAADKAAASITASEFSQIKNAWLIFAYEIRQAGMLD